MYIPQIELGEIMGGIEKSNAELFDQEYIRTMQFTVDLVDALRKQFGSEVLNIANRIVPEKERRHWAQVEFQKRTDTYIRKTQFTINFLDKLESRFGSGIAEVVKLHVKSEESGHWANIAQKEESHTMEDFIRLLWDPLPSIGLKFTVKQLEDGTQMNCYRCPFYDLALAIGGTKWLYIIECSRDFHNVSAFNPKIGFRRTKTLMEGHGCCDHFYFMKD